MKIISWGIKNYKSHDKLSVVVFTRLSHKETIQILIQCFFLDWRLTTYYNYIKLQPTYPIYQKETCTHIQFTNSLVFILRKHIFLQSIIIWITLANSAHIFCSFDWESEWAVKMVNNGSAQRLEINSNGEKYGEISILITTANETSLALCIMPGSLSDCLLGFKSNGTHVFAWHRLINRCVGRGHYEKKIFMILYINIYDVIFML